MKKIRLRLLGTFLLISIVLPAYASRSYAFTLTSIIPTEYKTFLNLDNGKQEAYIFTDAVPSLSENQFVSFDEGTSFFIAKNDGSRTIVDTSYGIDKIYLSGKNTTEGLVGIGENYGFLKFDGKLLNEKVYSDYDISPLSSPVRLFYFFDGDHWSAVSANGVVLANDIKKEHIKSKEYAQRVIHMNHEMFLEIITTSTLNNVTSYPLVEATKTLGFGNLRLSHGYIDMKGFSLNFEDTLIQNSSSYFSYAATKNYLLIETPSRLSVYSQADGNLIASSAITEQIDFWVIGVASKENDQFIITTCYNDVDGSVSSAIYDSKLLRVSNAFEGSIYLTDNSEYAVLDHEGGSGLLSLTSGKQSYEEQDAKVLALKGSSAIISKGNEILAVRFNKAFNGYEVLSSEDKGNNGSSPVCVSCSSGFVLYWDEVGTSFFNISQSKFETLEAVVSISSGVKSGAMLLVKDNEKGLYGARMIN
jgi:hypothetical protein